MVTRAALIMLLVMSKRAWWVLEQPVTSCMPSHPAMLHIQSLVGKLPWVQWHAADTFLGAFGAKTIKRVRLYSNKRWVHGLARSRPNPKDFKPSDTTTVTRKLVDGVEKVQVNGGPGLKESQEYPEECGL